MDTRMTSTLTPALASPSAMQRPMSPPPPPQVRLMTARQFVEALTRNRDDEEGLLLSTSQLAGILEDDEFERQYRECGGVELVLETIRRTQCRGDGLGGAMANLETLLRKQFGWDLLQEPGVVEQLVALLVSNSNVVVLLSGLSLLETVARGQEILFDRVYHALLANASEPIFHLLKQCARLDTDLPPAVIRFFTTCLGLLRQQGWPHFMAILEQGQIRNHVLGLMALATPTVRSAILGFQETVVAYSAYLTTISVEPTLESNRGQLAMVRAMEQFLVSVGSNTRDLDWTKLGFANADGTRALNEFNLARTGYLGLECLHYTLNENRKFFQSVPRDRVTTCPLAKASIAMTDLLCSYYGGLPAQARSEFELGRRGPTKVYQPFLFSFQRIHSLLTRAFFRIWDAMEADNTVEEEDGSDMESSRQRLTNDFDKVAIVVQELLFFTLDNEVEKTLTGIEKSFNEMTYQAIRERQWSRLKEARWANDRSDGPSDDLRRLHEQLEAEAEDFVAEVYIARLLEGEYFIAPPLVESAAGGGSRRASLAVDAIADQWRFWRLDSRRRYLYYEDGLRPDSGKSKPKWQEMSRRKITDLIVDPVRPTKGTKGIKGGHQRELSSLALAYPAPPGVSHVIHLMKGEAVGNSILVPMTLPQAPTLPGGAAVAGVGGDPAKTSSFKAGAITPDDLFSEWRTGLYYLVEARESGGGKHPIAPPPASAQATIATLVEMNLRIRRLTLEDDREGLTAGAADTGEAMTLDATDKAKEPDEMQHTRTLPPHPLSPPSFAEIAHIPTVYADVA